MERIFDICHGCRRCVSLCGSFPTLFDLVDESKTGEVDGVDKKDYWKVVDQCYMCDLCYMTKCPYVPPHEFNLDFPHTMLRAKAIKFKKGEVGTGEKFLSSTDIHGQFAGIPIVVQVANAVNKTKPARAAMEKILGVDKNAWLPELATKKFRSSVRSNRHRTRSRTAPRRRARWSSIQPATSTTTSRESATICSRFLTITNCPMCWSKKKNAAACPSWSWVTLNR